MAKDKLRKLDEMVTVVRRGSGCIGCMSSEDRYYIFRSGSGAEYTWHGGNANNVFLQEGQRVHVIASVAPTTMQDGTQVNYLRRVRVEMVS